MGATLTYHTYDDANDGPCATLDPWDDNDLLIHALIVISRGSPTDETERTKLALAFGEELLTIGIAQAQIRALIDEWHVTVKPPREFREGLAELRRENLAIVRARVTYQRALTKLKLTHERKAARSAVLEAAVTAYQSDELHYDTSDLNRAVSEWLKLAPTSDERAA